MPTVEIISIKSPGLKLKQDDFEIAIIEENRLHSHRSLFYDFLANQEGTIIHIGNPEYKNNTEDFFFAGELIDWEFEPGDIIIPEFEPEDAPTKGNSGANQMYKFKFASQYKSDIDKILKRALSGSPVKQIYILTDAQFGPERPQTEIIYTISELWTRHDLEGLIFNTMYEIYGL